ncbi:GNAT family N-acetyltransferase [Arthrobacter livingstonensis]|uniref:GNAT family N-acetyltransferase n=1 Tax=Arthrobacter livingstonensis TaxID=670078 RepID=UPI001FE8DDE8|nr:hypothetical protein [Arthrobacter livingstonensis]
MCSTTSCSTRADTSATACVLPRAGAVTRQKALQDALPIARQLGIDRALVTCDEDNTASRATIEGNGGVHEDSRDGKRRYWINT